MSAVCDTSCCAVKELNVSKDSFGFFYYIYRNKESIKNGNHLAVAYLTTEQSTIVKNKTDGIFRVDYVHDCDGVSYKRILERNYKTNWNETIDEHLERHLVKMACDLVEVKYQEEQLKDYHPSQFLMSFGCPFDVERNDETGFFAVVGHNHQPIAEFPALAQARLVCNALNTYNQPST